ncbi:hypothetical protein [Enterococcus aquimarinus]|uniref:hypothetical protein n=1 Tax=Enterococcus aquimarinus TaxID=328396 RepID=UPI001FEB1692|nr:hypothetical protein [Enterococcus aquimarinus]
MRVAKDMRSNTKQFVLLNNSIQPLGDNFTFEILVVFLSENELLFTRSVKPSLKILILLYYTPFFSKIEKVPSATVTKHLLESILSISENGRVTAPPVIYMDQKNKGIKSVIF